MFSLEHAAELSKARRKELKLTQRELADLARVSEKTIQNLEQGKENMQLAPLSSIFEVLGLKLSVERVTIDNR
ncbi:MAG: helix-turn-helix domain-containing protein [Microbacteriaceae bacterium]